MRPKYPGYITSEGLQWPTIVIYPSLPPNSIFFYTHFYGRERILFYLLWPMIVIYHSHTSNSIHVFSLLLRQMISSGLPADEPPAIHHVYWFHNPLAEEPLAIHHLSGRGCPKQPNPLLGTPYVSVSKLLSVKEIFTFLSLHQTLSRPEENLAN